MVKIINQTNGLKFLQHEAEMIERNTSYVDDEMTSVPAAFFQNKTNIVSIYLPNVTIIGENAFNGCTNLRMAVFPKVIDIGNNAFLNCVNLDTVVLFDSGDNGTIQPSTRPTIGISAFYGCTNLSTLYLGYTSSPEINATVASTFGNTLLNSTASTAGKIYVLTSTEVTNYKKAAAGAWSKNYLNNKLTASKYTGFPIINS